MDELHFWGILGIIGLIFGPTGTVALLFRGVYQRLDSIDHQLEKMNGTVDKNERRISVLEDRATFGRRINDRAP